MAVQVGCERPFNLSATGASREGLGVGSCPRSPMTRHLPSRQKSLPVFALTTANALLSETLPQLRRL
jgi:hypothetical protein